MPRTPRSTPPDTGLRHVVVAGGTGPGWLTFTDMAWQQRVRGCAVALAELSVPWLTLRPVSGALTEREQTPWLLHLAGVLDGRVTPHGVECQPLTGGPTSRVSVLVAPQADGRARFAQAVDSLGRSGLAVDDLDEAVLARALLAPSGLEPDLVVVLGPPNRLPPSLLWELAYAELVFLDLAWEELDPMHLQIAVDDFRRRDRRFGGVDS